MRSSGILMPIFSLPSEYGIGTFGKAAYEFVDFLIKAGQTYWQILPIGPTGYGDSPYQTFSSYAGNPYFIDLNILCDNGLLKKSEIEQTSEEQEKKIDYGFLYEKRLKTLKKAFKRFIPNTDYKNFCDKNAFWLEYYSLFMTIKELNNGIAWQNWDEALKNRDESAISEIKEKNSEKIEFYSFLQYEFSLQWHSLKDYANRKGIKIIGDIPIYVALDSADVWAEPEQFLLDKELKPTFVAGCPPDSFSPSGQLWGNPLYDWAYMECDGFHWLIKRTKYMLSLFDVIRIDHFRAFESFYSIPYGAESAESGKWVKAPGKRLFKALEGQLGENLPIIAEDLGFLTDDVRDLLKFTGYAGMKVLQFAFDSNEESDYLPHNYIKNTVVYTGTHDNDTVIGWSKTAKGTDLEYAQNYVLSSEPINMALIRLAMMSVSNTCIIPIQDFLGLGSNGRINIPSTLGNNWCWRVKKEQLSDSLADKIYNLTVLYGRKNARCF